MIAIGWTLNIKIQILNHDKIVSFGYFPFDRMKILTPFPLDFKFCLFLFLKLVVFDDIYMEAIIHNNTRLTTSISSRAQK